MKRMIPWQEFNAELTLVRHLVHEYPWQRGVNEDRGLRSEFRRWDASDQDPSVTMLAPLWRRVPADGWTGLNEIGLDRSVHHAAMLLHLLALGETVFSDKRPASNLGTAARRADVKEGRFNRLVNTPGTARLKALSRLCRQLRQKNVAYRLTISKPSDGEMERRSTLRTLRDGRVDDLAAILTFLFTDNPKVSISRWAAGYYHTDGHETEHFSTN